MNHDNRDSAKVEPRINPYAPAGAVGPEPHVESRSPIEETPSPVSLGKTAIRWLVVCGLSAIPSFVFGLALTEGDFTGMILGILIFAAAYTLLDYKTANRPFRMKRSVRRTLKIAYGTRIAISIVFPIGAYLDIVCGMLSVGLTQNITGVELRSPGPIGFYAAVFTTLVQGCVLNIVLGCYALLVHAFQLFVIALRRQPLSEPTHTT